MYCLLGLYGRFFYNVMIKGWIQNSIGWAIEKIQELWDGVASVVNGIN